MFHLPGRAAAATTINVTGRSGYEQSTDIWMTQDFDFTISQNTDEKEDDGWNVLGNVDQPAYGLKTFTKYHFADDVTGHTFTLEQGGLCNAIENIKIKPVGSFTHYNAYPKIQRKLLPYISRTDSRTNVT